MKYTLRLVWYIVKIVAIAVTAFAVLAVTFFVAMDSANVYVVVTDGLKAHASSILKPSNDDDLTKYFSQSYLKSEVVDTSAYSQYVITDFNYKLTVESLWCKPWENTATVTVVEDIPEFRYTTNSDAEAGATATEAKPTWPKARYQIECRRIDGAWRMTSVTLVESLLPTPTRTPEPTNYITATPLATASPTPGLITTPTPSPSPSPEAAES